MCACLSGLLRSIPRHFYELNSRRNVSLHLNPIQVFNDIGERVRQSSLTSHTRTEGGDAVGLSLVVQRSTGITLEASPSWIQ